MESAHTQHPTSWEDKCPRIEGVVRSWLLCYFNADSTSCDAGLISNLLSLGRHAIELQVSLFDACDFITHILQQLRPCTVIRHGSTAEEYHCFVRLLWIHTELVNDIIIPCITDILDNFPQSDMLIGKMSRVMAACFVPAATLECPHSSIHHSLVLQAKTVCDSYIHLSSMIVIAIEKQEIEHDAGIAMTHLITSAGDAARYKLSMYLL
jgi:hypothetical protein